MRLRRWTVEVRDCVDFRWHKPRRQFFHWTRWGAESRAARLNVRALPWVGLYGLKYRAARRASR